MLTPFAALVLHALAPSAGPRPEAKIVQVWLDADRVTRGSSIRIYVQTAEDGNLIVLHRRTDGRIEVLFPKDPAADPGVRAGTYEIRGLDDRPGWVVEEPVGSGMVLAALSPDPLRFDEFVREAGWNPAAFAPTWSGFDGEGAMSDVVQRMLGDGYFHYDLVTYTVAPPVYAQQYPTPLDTTSSLANAPPSAPCLDCTFIGVQVIMAEPFSFCDGFFTECLGARPFARHREPCGSLSPCGAPPSSALALALGPLPPPPLALAAGAPARHFAVPRGASGPNPIGPRIRAPARPVRSRAPAAVGVGALGSSAPRSPSHASRGPLTHVRFTRLSAPTPEAPVVGVAVRDGAGRGLTPAEGVTEALTETRAMPGTLGRGSPRSSGAASVGQGAAGQVAAARPAAREPVGAGRAMALVRMRASLPGPAGPTAVAASGAGATGTGGVVSSSAVGSGAAMRAGSGRGGVPVRRR